MPHPTAAAATPLDGWDLLLSATHRLETDIERLYLRRGAPEMRARFAVPLLHLAQIQRATIARLADAVGVTHSAMSQTVDAMGRFGWVATGRGRDGRIRVVELTDAGRAVLPALERVRRAVVQSLRELEGSLPGAPSTIGLGLASALRQRSLHERVVAQFDNSAAD
ncbi:MarR family winged helix-turn-helix transcriptional regulator [Microbacterium sp. Clip185]|uniref:MarR family winged helix-turn-helix transcriptional regulator n=1 Tax=Microbacterium sp. Clip185 TaxID=3025663 RepID=UPI0023659D2F|nr:winged helix DNA-binding protein [Microbacterium sp. Clip185]WDG17288.1 winged helix DNA-binding protein [Microbacterium sp. Clip185]